MSTRPTGWTERWLVALCCLGLLPGFAPAVAEDVPDDGLVRGGKVPTMFLLYTGDVIGYLETCGCKKNPAGGLGRRNWVVEEIKRKFPAAPILMLDSGNFSDNPTPQGDAKTRALVTGMGKMGYAAANVGERDVKLGYDWFVERTKHAVFPFVSANIVRHDTGEPIFDPYTIVEAAAPEGERKRRFGVIGVARFNPNFLKAGPGESNMKIAHPIEPVRQAVEALEAQGVDGIVLLAALYKEDAKRIAREVPGIDFIVGSYGGAVTQAGEREGDSWILYSGNQGKHLGETRVFTDAEGAVQATTTIMHLLTKLYPVEPEMQQFVDTVPLDGRRTSGVAPAPVETGPFVGSAACRKCHLGAFDQWNSTPHAHAYARLAEAKGPADAACVACHVTGFELAGGFESATATPDLVHVGCESCHGAGRDHLANNLARYGRVEVNTCVGCHDLANSPEFDYYTYLPRVIHGGRASR